MKSKAELTMSFNKGTHPDLKSILNAHLNTNGTHKAEEFFKKTVPKCVDMCVVCKEKKEVTLISVTVGMLGFRNGAKLKDVLRKVFNESGAFSIIDYVTLGTLTLEEALLAGLSESFENLPEGQSFLLGMTPISRTNTKGIRRRHDYIFKLINQGGVLVSQCVPFKLSRDQVFPPQTTFLFAVRKVQKEEKQQKVVGPKKFNHNSGII